MKIESSTVTMRSERSYYSHLEQKSAELLTTSGEAARLELSDESKSYVEQLNDYKEEKKRQAQKQEEEQKKQNTKELMAAITEAEKNRQKEREVSVKSPEELKLETLKCILEMLRSMRKGKTSLLTNMGLAEDIKQQIKELKAGMSGYSSYAGSTSLSVSDGLSTAQTTTWKRVTVTSSFYTEAEHTAYQAQGLVRTQDGREITFDVQVEMSRAFCEKYDSCMVETVVCVDPLVFHLEGDAGGISDQKFLFDLNADGTEEEISFTEWGSGFLALDKNGDGEINDGSELFGTQSGDGFADLAAYDEDGNGWIDENDAVFQNLTIWTLNDAGEKVQLSLKEADVGAIYLGKAATEYSLKNTTTNATKGVIRSTGVYLKESGGAGTVQHIDLTL